jgi:hypothetical protein
VKLMIAALADEVAISAKAAVATTEMERMLVMSQDVLGKRTKEGTETGECQRSTIRNQCTH